MVNTIESVKVLDPESQRGSVEYKRQIIDPTPTRLRTLATQMSFRIDEGKGTAIYQIGVEDDGSHSLLDFDVIEKSVNALELLARSLNAIVIEKTFYQGEAVTQQCLEGQQQSDMKHNGHPVVIQETITTNASLTLSMLNIDVNGSSSDKEEKYDSCLNENVKSPYVSTFTKINTNKGIPTRCKMTLQRIETHLLDPTPKSLSDIANFASQCTIEPSSTSKNTFPTTDTTIPSSTISISDTLSLRNIRVAVVGNVDAGKSTLIGTLTTSSLDDGRGRSRTSIMKHRHEIESGRTSTATTHLMGFKSNGQPIAGRDFVKAPNKTKSEDEIARESFRVVTFMDLAGHEKYLKTTIHGVSSGFADYVFTKVDGCPDHALKTSKEEVIRLLRSPEVSKRPFMIHNEKDVETCLEKMHSLAPMFLTSCVEGTGLDLLKKMLFSLPKRRHHENKIDRPFEFLIEDIFNVPGVGSVVSGFVNAGSLTVGAKSDVLLGPMEDGTFIKTIAKSAHIARISTNHVISGQSACLALSLNKDMKKKLRRGMVVLKENPTSTKEFDAEICVLKGEGTTIRDSYQAYVHILNVRQSAFARKIEIVKAGILVPSHSHPRDEGGLVLRPGSRAKVRFEFAQRPEYIRAGMRMLFRDGRVRGVGIITGIPNSN